VSKYPTPPPSLRQDVKDTLHGVAVADPYRWLEDASSAETQQWVTEQAGYARRILDALPRHAALSERFTELLYLDAVSPPVERGGNKFYTRRYKDKEKAVLMVRPNKGEERALIDPSAISTDGSISLGGWFPSWDGKLVAYALHQNNPTKRRSTCGTSTAARTRTSTSSAARSTPAPPGRRTTKASTTSGCRTTRR